MRFGIKTAPQHTTWAEMLDVWRAADDIDLFESAWNFDHFYPIFSDSDGPCLEAWTMLAAMAQATRLILLLTQEHSNLDGKYVQLREARCEPKPVQQPHPPITIGGNGPTRTLRT